MRKLNRRISIDKVARELSNGHYVVQSSLTPSPQRDKLISTAISKIKSDSSIVKTRQ